MIASTAFLTWMVIAGLSVTVCAPILLIILLIRDWRAGRLW